VEDSCFGNPKSPSPRTMQDFSRQNGSCLLKPLPELTAWDPQPLLLQTLEVPRGSVGTALFHAVTNAVQGTRCSSDYAVFMVKEFYTVSYLFFSLNWSLKTLPDTKLMKAHGSLLKDISRIMSFMY